MRGILRPFRSPRRARENDVEEMIRELEPMTMSSSEAAARPRQRSFWIAVICGAVILTIGMGARQSFGIFQKPIAADLKVGRELWSFANALAMLLMGVFSPFVGNLADRFGTAQRPI